MNVSVIITNYNYGRFLAATIESAMNQTYAAKEVIVVDDGSSDESAEIIRRWEKEYPGRAIGVFQANAGQAAAINRAFESSTGEILCLLDADDLWDDNKIERTVAAFEKSPAASMFMHHLRHTGAGGAVLKEDGCGWRPGGELGSLMIRSGGAWVFGATSSLCLRREALDKILPIPCERWRLCADGAIAYPAVFLGDVISSDEVLGGYRIHGANNHYAAGLDSEKVQADVEMTNQYLNDFLKRIGRAERVDLMRNLHYRRDRFYRHGGDAGEMLAIARLILGWPLYRGPIERAKFLARFFAGAARGLRRGEAARGVRSSVA